MTDSPELAALRALRDALRLQGRYTTIYDGGGSVLGKALAEAERILDPVKLPALPLEAAGDVCPLAEMTMGPFVWRVGKSDWELGFLSCEGALYADDGKPLRDSLGVEAVAVRLRLQAE